ncbi:glycosyl transferase [Xanthomonas citri pv. fuscans]|uniref:Glycosyl transferase n=1 Tax=Xanthomonas citri pv. fuscans TaxID=366649 RepID=A0AB34QAF5_XANCI|nr:MULTISPECIES: glycosyltransferase [Xanthomonas]ATS64144.1 glycosyltransferase [Xanthomonas citri pv. phaseoli var. fuscans]ATS70791.1 glycosyltransferase [Xanthomonas citri pv. phaseoli var. fuscans]ATS77371.1 glycosyltransferase [Xanthomonas citri pv. phaseoli var. fuscans]ATS79736.1 glycosyltransferase [Xanthomonas citri pv. phaseoli var. fuscans]ATS89395.1 glycosyltransferase [Xanthomonas citri pv. phaseoli var. fuscans]
MSMSLADARYLFNRVLGLIHRSVASTRTRGWRATWQRIRVHTQAPPVVLGTPLWLPQAAPFAAFALPHSPTPRVTVVIPVYNHIAHTLACLRALAAHPPLLSVEIIVVDDGSSDATAEQLPQIAGLQYHPRASNGGFIAACNDGIALARGDFVVLLNNDTIPQPGWLDRLIDTFARYPGAGLVGAQLVYPDGRLQESGGVVFGDGSAWSYGRFESSEDPRYAYVRAMDYCSGAAIALPRTLLHTLGGLDRRYMPAYYEDTDLAFAVRAAGYQVLVQPASVVVHDRTNETKTGSVVAEHQRQFAKKWALQLGKQVQQPVLPGPALLHRHQRQVLILDECVPQPDRDSGSLRQFNLIRLLREEGAHVVFVPTRREHAGRHTQALQQLGVEVWYAPFLEGIGSWLRSHGARFAVVLLVRHHVAHACLPLLRQYARQARTLFDTVDLHYLRERRGAELAGDANLLRSAERTRVRELEIMAATDVTLLVSAAEQAQLRADAPHIRTALLSNLHEVAGSGHSFAQRRGLVFVGGFRHPPNVDAVQWFISEIFPQVRAQLPEVVFHCIGADLPDALKLLADECPGVRLHGHVPDLVPFMDSARIAVAPLRFGAGVKGKINLSMAHGQPVVGTTCAVEGMHLRDGEDVCVADDAEAFAAAIVRLYQDATLWQRLADNGLRNVAEHFSLDAARATVRELFIAG